MKTTALTPIDLDDDDGDAGTIFAKFDSATESKWFARKGGALAKARWLLIAPTKRSSSASSKRPVYPSRTWPSLTQTPCRKRCWRTPSAEGPYDLNYVVGLANIDTGEKIISSNSTKGQEHAFRELKSRIITKRALHGGANLVPVIELSSTLMPTNYGPKLRPEFKVLEWRDLGGAPAPAIAPAPAQGLPGTAVEKPTSAEIIGDKIDDVSPPPKTAKAPEYAPKKSRRIKRSSSLDDGFGSFGE